MQTEANDDVPSRHSSYGYNAATSMMRRQVKLGVAAALATSAACVVAWSAVGPLQAVSQQLSTGRPPAGGWTVDRVITAGAAVGLAAGGAVVVALLTLNCLSLCLASGLPALDEFSRRVTPTMLRRAASALCGLALTAPATVQAHADDRPLNPSAERSARLAGLPLPDLPSTAGRVTVTVRTGDCLWSIAERRLPADAPNAVVAARVSRWYGRNRSVIGRDPDVIFPGQRLTAPGGAA